MDGPRCGLVNGLEARRSTQRAEAAAVSSSWRERLLGLVATHLKAGLEAEDGTEPISGAFEVRGEVPGRQGGDFYLAAGEWLDRPEGWITVGLRGSFDDNVTLVGEITDGDGETLEACSRFTLQRDEDVDAGYAGAAGGAAALVGVWEGVYICAGTPTRLVLTLAGDHVSLPAELDGVFEFRVLQNLNEYELKEITRLVGESLLDLRNGPRGSEDVIIIAGDQVIHDFY